MRDSGVENIASRETTDLGGKETVDLGRRHNSGVNVEDGTIAIHPRFVEATLHERVHRAPNKRNPNALKRYVEDLRQYANMQLAWLNDERLQPHERREIVLERPVSDESMGGTGVVYKATVNPELSFEVRGKPIKTKAVAVKISYPTSFNDSRLILPAYIDQNRRKMAREGQTTRTLWNHLRKKSTAPLQPKQVPGIGYAWELTKSFLDQLRKNYVKENPHYEQHLVYCFKSGEIGRDDTVAYQIQEYVNGLNIWQYVKTKGALGLTRKSAGVAKDVAVVLEGILELEMYNRDVSPGNIIIGDDGVNKVCDLGLIKGASEYLGETRFKEVVGTPGFMAPEHLSTALPIGDRSDIWSLGAVLFYLVGGEIPYKRDEELMGGTHKSISQGQTGAKRELAQLIEASIEVDPRNRPRPEGLRIRYEKLYDRLE